MRRTESPVPHTPVHHADPRPAAQAPPHAETDAPVDDPGVRDGRPPRIALVGAHGHGTSHLTHLRHLVARGAVELLAVADPRPLADEAQAVEAAARGQRLAVAPGTPWYPDLAALLAADVPDVVVLCTPIATHATLAETALRAGCDVLLEKPSTATLAELEHLVDVTRETGRAVQVGFQTFGSHALDVVRGLVAEGRIGSLRGVGGVGTWVRPEAYWTRAPWAGRRTLDGRPVVDGVTTNPLAHAVATALLLAGARTSQDVTEVELDLARANPIEADDTTSVRVTTRSGVRVALGLTLCAATHSAPRLVVHGSTGRIVLHYTDDVVEVSDADGTRQIRCGRTDLLENLLAHRVDPAVPLLAPLASTGAFMRVLEAVRRAPAPRRIAPDLVTRIEDQHGPHLVVHDVEHWCARVADELRTFGELGAPWAARA